MRNLSNGVFRTQASNTSAQRSSEEEKARFWHPGTRWRMALPLSLLLPLNTEKRGVSGLPRPTMLTIRILIVSGTVGGSAVAELPRAPFD